MISMKGFMQDKSISLAVMVTLSFSLVSPALALSPGVEKMQDLGRLDLLAVAQAKSSADDAKKSGSQKTFSGNSSWYGVPFHGRKTASGEIFDMNKLSAAHLTFPFPTYCLIEDPRTGNTVIVKVNDRGPYAKGRVMDLSREAARRLGTMSRGVAYVEGIVLGRKAPPTPPTTSSSEAKP